jgi:hypothetical protein
MLCKPDLDGPVATISSRRAIILIWNLISRKPIATWAIARGLTANTYKHVPHFPRAHTLRNLRTSYLEFPCYPR